MNFVQEIPGLESIIVGYCYYIGSGDKQFHYQYKLQLLLLDLLATYNYFINFIQKLVVNRIK